MTGTRSDAPRSGALVALVTLAACGAEAPAPPAAPDEVIVALTSASADAPLGAIEPSAISAHATSLGGNRFRVPRAEAPSALELPGFCPHALELPAGPDARVQIALDPLLDVLLPAPPGHDAAFRIEVRPGCREAVAGSVEWTIVDPGGAPLEGPEAERVALRTERRGFVAAGRTPPLGLRARPRRGIVPISARAAGEVRLRMRWARAGAEPVERTVRVLAEARATGMPSVGAGAAVLLAGGPFEVAERPAGARAEVTPGAGDLERFLPDALGRWVLRDAGGGTLAIRVGEHGTTPLDCGRSDCHAEASARALESPMTGALAAHVSEPCALACHATGEPGLPDGGFAHVARALGWHAPDAAPSDPAAVLGRPLRRLAGVGCTACHGPGAIPEEGAGWAILRGDVCATCHDAPPRYGHVEAWSRSAMAGSDARGGTSAPECTACHTTAGFLAAIGARARTAVPADAGPLGIACAACHAPHSAERLDRALVRRVPAPASLEPLPPAWRGSTSTICLRCHASPGGIAALGAEGAAPVPIATSALVLLGRGRVRADGTPLGGGATSAGDGAPAAAPAPHADLPCLECHGAPSTDAGLGVERGAGHAFAVDFARCARCHAESAAALAEGGAWARARTALAARARAVAAELGLGPDDHRTRVPADVTMPRGRAVENARLVLGDRGAWAHAPGYAAALLGD